MFADFPGKNCCACVLGIGFSEKYGRKKTDNPAGGDAERAVQGAPRSAEMGVGRLGNGS